MIRGAFVLSIGLAVAAVAPAQEPAFTWRST